MIISNKKNTNNGFVALISAIIISVILLLIVVNVSLTGFYSRSNVLDTELKEKSVSLAEACVDTALLRLANDTSYVGGGATVAVSGSDTCTIDATTTTNPRVFTTHANYKNYITNIQIAVDTATLAITRWEEI